MAAPAVGAALKKVATYILTDKQGRGIDCGHYTRNYPTTDRCATCNF